MKPVIELSAVHVGQQVRIVDQHLTITGTLAGVRAWSETEETRNLFGRAFRVDTSLFIEVEILGAGTTQLTHRAEFEVTE